MEQPSQFAWQQSDCDQVSVASPMLTIQRKYSDTESLIEEFKNIREVV